MRNNKFEIKIESNVPKVRGELKSKLRKIFEMWGIFLTKEWVMRIKKAKLIDTGRFMNSVTYKSDDKQTIVGNPVEYASFLENGTSKRRARPTLKPAILENREKLKDMAKNELEK